MQPLFVQVQSELTPGEALQGLVAADRPILLESRGESSAFSRYSFLVARPFLIFRSFGARCELRDHKGAEELFGNPWHVLDSLMARYELLDHCDFPFPLGGCFGVWGYDLKNFVEPKLSRGAVTDLELPDC